MSNVIQIEDMRLTRSSRYHPLTECNHMHLTMDGEGEIVTCDDCKKQISAFWALQMLSDQYRKASEKLDRKYKEQIAVESKTVHLKAAQKVEEAWRSRTMVPTCPHCAEPIFPNDGFGRHQINKQFAERMRSESKIKGIK